MLMVSFEKSSHICNLNNLLYTFPATDIRVVPLKSFICYDAFLGIVHFVLTILFVLALASDMAVLYENDAFSTLVLSVNKMFSSFLKKIFVFQKIFFKVKVLKSFKISTDCHIKICRSFKRRAILKIPSTVF